MKVLAELSSHLVHDQTLLGAVDSFLKELVHVRPYRLSQYEAALAALVDAWFAHAGRNQLVAVDESWLQQYLATTADAAATRQVVDDLYRWAVRTNLIAQHPLCKLPSC
jgi:hypothetical protein